MITAQNLETFITQLPGVQKSYPFQKTIAVFRVHDAMFALIDEQSNPVRISLRSDPQLAEHLREKYETVLPGQNLNPKQWNTVICSGQLSEAEVQDLIRHAYYLIAS